MSVVIEDGASEPEVARSLSVLRAAGGRGDRNDRQNIHFPQSGPDRRRSLQRHQRRAWTWLWRSGYLRGCRERVQIWLGGVIARIGGEKFTRLTLGAGFEGEEIIAHDGTTMPVIARFGVTALAPLHPAVDARPSSLQGLERRR